MKARGYTFPYGPKTVFVQTTRERKTQSLARNILRELKCPDGRSAELLYWLQKAEIEIKKLDNGDEYYSLSGKNFSECGPVDMIKVIKVI